MPSVDFYVRCVKLAKGASFSHIPFCERYWYFLSMMDIETLSERLSERLSDEAATLASAASALVDGTGEQESKDAAAQIDHVCSPNRLELEKVELLLKVGLNLKFLHEAKKAAKKQL